MKSVRLLIKGRVQGVGYRWFAREKARDLGVHGYVRNLPTGEVEVLAQADEKAIDKLIMELQQGPAFAHVIDIQIEELENLKKVYDSFEIAF